MTIREAKVQVWELDGAAELRSEVAVEVVATTRQARDDLEVVCAGGGGGGGEAGCGGGG